MQLFGSLKSRDPGDVFAEVMVLHPTSHFMCSLSHTAHKAAAEARIRVSVVGLSAELYVLKYMCDCCEGTYTVASDGEHLKQLLHMHIPGPPSDKEQPTVAPFIQMGFPSKLRSSLPM
jgi:hypothetical protein